MSKINVNGITYDKLGEIKIGNHEYAFGLSDNNIEYFEKVTVDNDIKYNALNKDLTLEGNAGTSLTKLNERIVMNYIATSIKSDIKIGNLKNLEDLSKELNIVQSVINDEPNIKKLLKGNVNELDEESFAKSAKDLISYFKSRIKDKKRINDDFDIIEGGIDRTFTSNSLYDDLRKETQLKKETKKEESYFVDEELSPTIIVDRLDDVDKKVLQAETKKEVPSTDIIGVSKVDLTDDVIRQVLTRKQDQITPAQTAYLEKILESKEEKVDIIKEEPKIEEVKEVKEDINELDQTLLFIKKEEPKEEVQDEIKEEVKKEEKPKTLTKTKKSNKAAYVDTVILCLLTQLGIFGLLIFVLLVIK